jgi:RNA polymerase sigma factor (sigma-70 family)
MTRNINTLLSNYKPLVLATYKRFHPMFKNQEDKEDLMSEINIIFTKLVWEYDSRKGVDFPYYIKRMLELRTYHYITKQLKVKNKETLVESLTNDEITFDKYVKDDFEELINVASWDDDFNMGKKQKSLFIGLLRDHKSLQQLADEEGVKVSTLHTRLHFLIKKLKGQTAQQKSMEE